MKGTTQEAITKEVIDIAAKKLGVKHGDISFEVGGSFIVLVHNYVIMSLVSSLGFLEEKISTCSWQGWKSDSLTAICIVKKHLYLHQPLTSPFSEYYFRKDATI